MNAVETHPVATSAKALIESVGLSPCGPADWAGTAHGNRTDSRGAGGPCTRSSGGNCRVPGCRYVTRRLAQKARRAACTHPPRPGRGALRPWCRTDTRRSVAGTSCATSSPRRLPLRCMPPTCSATSCATGGSGCTEGRQPGFSLTLPAMEYTASSVAGGCCTGRAGEWMPPKVRQARRGVAPRSAGFSALSSPCSTGTTGLHIFMCATATHRRSSRSRASAFSGGGCPRERWGW